MNYVNHDKIDLQYFYVFQYFFFVTYIKMSKDSSRKYYQNNKERQKKGSWKLSKEDKEKKQQYCHERYKNLPEACRE